MSKIHIPRHYRKQYRVEFVRQEPKYELLPRLGAYDIGTETFAKDVTPAEVRDAPPKYLDVHDANLEETLA